jgi:hypothetical protein
MEFRDCDFVALNREDGQAGHGQGVRYINTLKYRCHLQLRSQPKPTAGSSPQEV